MYIIGISYGYHDSSLCIVEGKKIVAVYSEERFSRKKHDSGFPTNAWEYAKKLHGINSSTIEAVAYYEDPILKLQRIKDQINDIPEFIEYLSSKSAKNEFATPLKEISSKLNISTNLVHFLGHHDSHLFASLSLLEDKSQNHTTLTCLTADGVGEMISTALHGVEINNGKINHLSTKESHFPNSIGLFYSAITSFLGFEVNDAEYKVMGLAAYGEPTMCEQFSKVINYNEANLVQLNTEFFDFSPSAPFPYTAEFTKLFGKPAPKSTSYVEEFSSIEAVKNDPNLKHYADIACSAQQAITSILVRILKAVETSNTKHPVIYGGGVALNTKANYSLAKIRNLLITPDPGDGGNSLGAACAYSAIKKGILPRFITPYLGHDIKKESIEDIYRNLSGLSVTSFNNLNETIEAAVTYLSNGDVIGWTQGRAEFGPRALGNRSILANPQNPNAQLFVNKAVKFREPFRPFAPSILEEYLDELFDTSCIDLRHQNSPLHYMLLTLPAKKLAYDLIPACIHVDGTSRVQVVSRKSNSTYYDLLKTFHSISGIPGVLNTSFNLRGEPMVNTVSDAIKTFSKSGMKSLFINNTMILKD